MKEKKNSMVNIVFFMLTFKPKGEHSSNTHLSTHKTQTK